MEGFYKVAFAGGSAAVTFLFGGQSALLSVLVAFVIFDFVSGLIAAGVEGKLKSKVGLIGIARKVFIFGMVAVAHLTDVALGDQKSRPDSLEEKRKMR